MNERGKKRELTGVVVSDKGNKTILVETQRRISHPMYKKIMIQRAKFAAHDEQNDARAGDTVVIRESRPLSRTKRWRLVEVLRRAPIMRTKEEILAGEAPTSKEGVA